MSERKVPSTLLLWFVAFMPAAGGMLSLQLTQLSTGVGVRGVASMPLMIVGTMHLAGLPAAAFVAMIAYRRKEPLLATLALMSFFVGCACLLKLFFGGHP